MVSPTFEFVASLPEIIDFFQRSLGLYFCYIFDPLLSLILILISFCLLTSLSTTFSTGAAKALEEAVKAEEELTSFST